MIITKLHLINFGKFKDRVIELKPGLNLIYGANEAGKSTVHDFIEGMLYGFKKADARRRSYTPKRQRYKPWLASAYAGAMEYETEDNRSYRIERDFNSDRVSIYDSSGQDIALIGPMSAGTREPDAITQHWGISSTAFVNTISIDQRNTFSTQAMAKEVADGWLNMMQSGRQDLSVTAALSRLTRMLDDIGSDSAPTRPWARALQKLQQLNAERDMVQKRMDNMADAIARAHALRSEIEELRKQQGSELSDEALDSDADIAYNRRRKAELERELASLASLNAYIEQNGCDPLEELLSLDRQFEAAKAELDALNAAGNRHEEENATKRLNNAKSRLYLYIILIATSAIAAVAIHPALAVVLIPLIWMLIRDRAEIKRLTRTLKQLSQAHEQQYQQVKMRCDALADKKQQLLEQIGAADTAQVMAMLRRVDAASHEIERLDAEYQWSVQQKRQQRLAALSQQIHSRETELAALEASADASLAGLRSLAAIDEDIEQIKQEINEMAFKKNAVQKAIDIISGLSADIQRDFSPYLSQAAASITSHITGGRYVDIKISPEMYIKVIEPDSGLTVPLESLSAGTIDQLYLAIRLAIADMLSDNRNLPLIIDDAFSEYDDIRLMNAMAYIGQLAQKRQVLILTCHQRDEETLDKLGIPFNYIEL